MAGASRSSRGRLNKPDDVAICVLHGSDQLASTHVLDLLLHLCTGVEERLQTLRDVGNVPVTDRARHPLAVAVGIQTDILALNVEADLVSLNHVGLHAQKLAVQRLGLREVFDRVDDCLNAFSHEELLRVAEV